MKKLKISFLYFILIMFITPLAAHSKMYIWTDENGVKHVSNTAPPQNTKNIQRKDEKKFDEEKYQRNKEQQQINAAKEEEGNRIKQAEASQRELEQKRENLSGQFYNYANEMSSQKFGEKRARVLESIGDSFQNCPGDDLNAAFNYYKKAKAAVSDIKPCKKRRTEGTHIVNYWSKKCVNRLIQNAMNHKKTGDSYMGCSQEYLKTVMERDIQIMKSRPALSKSRSASSAIKDPGPCIGGCGAEQGICIAGCQGNGICISNCAAAHGRCVARCHQ